MTKLGIGAALVLASGMQAAGATLVADGGGAVVDTDAGVQWLTNDATRNYSYAQLAAGGTAWPGYRIATLPEVQLLFVHAGVPSDQLPAAHTLEAYNATRSFVELMHGVQTPLGGYVAGYFRSDPVNPTLAIVSFVTAASAGAYNDNTVLGIFQPDPRYGGWMVAPAADVAPVPEPASWTLMVATLAMMIGYKRWQMRPMRTLTTSSRPSRSTCSATT